MAVMSHFRVMVVSSTAVAGVVVASLGVMSPAALAGPVAPGVSGAAACATLRLTATPRVNAQNAPYETIKNGVTSCSTKTETVTLTQRIVGPDTASTFASPFRTWTITLSPGETVVKVQHIPYSCCGTYAVTDRILSSGHLLATKKTSFTFA